MKDFLQLNSELYDLYRSVVESRVHDVDRKLSSIRDKISPDAPQSIRQSYLNFSRLIAGHASVREVCLTLPETVQDGVAMRHHTLLGGIEPGGAPGVSLVTCAMNRTDNLLKALGSWLAHSQISEVIIVDWSSRVPVSQSLEDAGVDDPRIRVIRVEDEPRWILSYAFNVGFRIRVSQQLRGAMHRPKRGSQRLRMGGRASAAGAGRLAPRQAGPFRSFLPLHVGF